MPEPHGRDIAPEAVPIVSQGPFVMNSLAQVRQALEDFRGGRC
jgi:redox-sensitive bicupin YhaK (pirin superfamily)